MGQESALVQLKQAFIGKPIPSELAHHERLSRTTGLAVLSSDALSSVAYATEEVLRVLVLGGVAATALVTPISAVIALLLVVVALSYRQTIMAYPGGGGAYIVAKENLGVQYGLVAAASLLVDYILTVAVSVAAGVAAFTSAVPQLLHLRVELALLFLVILMLGNLRGIRESGLIFAAPTYFFIVTVLVLIGVGAFRFFTGGVAPLPAEAAPVAGGTGLLGGFLILRAFANGCTAMTGVEAVSNGVPAFKPPEARNAASVLGTMAVLAVTMFLGITLLAHAYHILPAEHETVISQLARAVFDGRGILYLAAIGATTLILVMAANTAFADFPRLAALQAADGFLPRQLTYRGSRLVYSRGILLLALIASLLIAVFQASVTGLIPLYAIGVFLSFTLSQAGMARRWRKVGRLGAGEEQKERGSVLKPDRRWRAKMIVNGVGAVITAIVTLIFASTKFTSGAWVVLIVIPALVVFFFAIHRHYQRLARALSLDAFGPPVRVDRHRVILAVSGVHRGTVAGLHYARSLSEDVTAVYVATDPEAATAVQEKWGYWGAGVRLVILDSPYRLLIEPLVGYVRELAARRQPNEVMTIVVPQFVPEQGWHNILHAQTAIMLRFALLFQPGVVITSVPYQVRTEA